MLSAEDASARIGTCCVSCHEMAGQSEGHGAAGTRADGRGCSACCRSALGRGGSRPSACAGSARGAGGGASCTRLGQRQPHRKARRGLRYRGRGRARSPRCLRRCKGGEDGGSAAAAGGVPKQCTHYVSTPTSAKPAFSRFETGLMMNLGESVWHLDRSRVSSAISQPAQATSRADSPHDAHPDGLRRLELRRHGEGDDRRLVPRDKVLAPELQLVHPRVALVQAREPRLLEACATGQHLVLVGGRELTHERQTHAQRGRARDWR